MKPLALFACFALIGCERPYTQYVSVEPSFLTRVHVDASQCPGYHKNSKWITIQPDQVCVLILTPEKP